MVISIPAFREEGDRQREALEASVKISIPAFREEGDLPTHQKPKTYAKFQPPPPVRKATPCLPRSLDDSLISIPAFREEGDGEP